VIQSPGFLGVNALRRALPLALLMALFAACPAVAGTISGRVDLVEKGGRKATDLSDVVVYVEGARARTRSAAGPNPSIIMKGKSFTPRVVVVPVGGTVEFPNEDPIFHNVFSVSGENRFDLQLYKRPKSGAQTFHHAGLVRIYCNIHPQMSAVVLVRDNPYFAKAAPDGSFTIEGVPAGKYTLTAWHDKAGAASQEIVVPAQGPVGARPMSLDASGFKQVPHKNKFGKDYSSDEKY
jgi:plastocyanin